MKAKITILLFSVVLAPFFIFFLLELSVRYLPMESVFYEIIEKQNHHCKTSLENKYRLAISQTSQKKTNFIQDDFESKKMAKNYDFFATNEFGYVYHKEKQNFRQTARIVGTDEVVYDVMYGFGDGGRRKVPGAENISARSHLAISGCSVVFGEGLEDKQTLPAFVQKYFKQTIVYNLGRVGGSVVDAVTTLHSTRLWKDIHPQPGVLVFYHGQQTHLPRFLGTLTLIGSWNGQAAFLNENESKGEFKFGGVYYKDKRAWTWLSQLAIKSKLLKILAFDWPLQSTSAMDAYVRALAFLRLEYQRVTAKNNPMVVYLAPGDTESCKIIPFLEKYKIFYLDYTNWYPQNYAKAQLKIKYDGHPTEEYNKIFGKQLAQDLQSVENQKKIGRIFD